MLLDVMLGKTVVAFGASVVLKPGPPPPPPPPIVVVSIDTMTVVMVVVVEVEVVDDEVVTPEKRK